MADCPAFDPAGPYVGQVLGLVDCHAQGLAEQGWRALAAPSGFGAGVTGLLTIAVALLGYRLMLGGRIALRDGVGLGLRIGVVLALCTQWAAWDALAFRLGTQGPESLALAVLAPSGLGAEDRYGLAIRLDRLGEAVSTLIDTPQQAPQPQPTPGPQPSGQQAQGQAPDQASPPGTTLSAEQKHDLGRALDLATAAALAGLVAVRVVMSVLLAVGPLFAASLLFASTQALFAGWLRAVAGTLLAALVVPLVLALELAVLEPQVAQVSALVGSANPLGNAVGQIGITALGFAAVLGAVVLGVGWAARALRLPGGALVSVETRARGESHRTAPVPLLPAPRHEEHSRAQGIADAVLRAQRREEQAGVPARAHLVAASMGGAGALRGEAQAAPLPLGQAARRASARRSASAARRDGAR